MLLPLSNITKTGWRHLFTLLIGVMLSLTLDSHATAQSGRGLSPEAREALNTLSRKEQKAFRALNKRDRRKFIEELLANSGNAGNKPEAQEETVAPAAQEETVAPAAPQTTLSLDRFVPLSEISPDILIMVGKNSGGNAKANVTLQKTRGGIETGLEPAFINGAACPEIDSEKWAIDYSGKRSKAAIHKGIDIPQPRGTAIRAVAAGTVVGKFMNDGNRKGIEIMLRHTPEQTGLPLWTYSQYTHLQEMPTLPIGATVTMGQEIGKTSNTGTMGKRIRRDALHFAILYSTQPEWSASRRFIVPKDGYWMDPNAFYRSAMPIDSVSMAALPKDQKQISVPYMKPDGSFVPPTTKRIWPYPCP